MSWLRTLLRRPKPVPRLRSDERIRAEIRVEVRCGYGSEEEVRGQLTRFLDGHPSAKAWLAELETALAEQRERERGWVELTHNDRIDRAFVELGARGIIALQDAGYTMSDGWSDAGDAAEDQPDARGATFFHRQDVERGVDGEGLLLAFGAFDDGPAHEAKSLALATEVCETLARHGLTTTWSGTLESRIEIAPFEWRKRRISAPPS